MKGDEVASSSSISEQMGKILREVRIRRGLTMTQLSKLSGTAVSSLSDWETGTHCPNAKRLESLIKLLQPTSSEVAHLKFLQGSHLSSITIDNISVRTFQGEAIRGLRLRQNLSQKQLANEIGVTQGAISSWESGNKLPSSDSLPGLFRLLCTFSGEEKFLQINNPSTLEVISTTFNYTQSKQFESSLPSLKDLTEGADILQIALLVAIIKSRWTFDPTWRPSLIAVAELYADALMSAHRNEELFSFTSQIISELQILPGESLQAENLIIMKNLAVVRHAPLRLASKYTYGTFERAVMRFKFSKVWGKSVLCQLAVNLGMYQEAEKVLFANPLPASSQPDTLKIDAQVHIVAHLCGEVGNPTAGLNHLEKYWDAYWKWADSESPYMAIAHKTRSRILTQMGFSDEAAQSLFNGFKHLSKVSKETRPGSFKYVHAQLNQQLDYYNDSMQSEQRF